MSGYQYIIIQHSKSNLPKKYYFTRKLLELNRPADLTGRDKKLYARYKQVERKFQEYKDKTGIDKWNLNYEYRPNR